MRARLFGLLWLSLACCLLGLPSAWAAETVLRAGPSPESTQVAEPSGAGANGFSAGAEEANTRADGFNAGVEGTNSGVGGASASVEAAGAAGQPEGTTATQGENLSQGAGGAGNASWPASGSASGSAANASSSVFVAGGAESAESPRGLLSLDAPFEAPLGSLMDPVGDGFERGGASWYGLKWHRRRTASGERFDMNALTAAHRTLPFGTQVCVRNLQNGKTVQVRINDRGPHVWGRIIDLSRAAAVALGIMATGTKEVALSLLESSDRSCAQ